MSFYSNNCCYYSKNEYDFLQNFFYLYNWYPLSGLFEGDSVHIFKKKKKTFKHLYGAQLYSMSRISSEATFFFWKCHSSRHSVPSLWRLVAEKRF